MPLRTSKRSALSFQTSICTILPLMYDEAVDVAVTLERCAVGPLAVECAEIVDDGLADAGNDVAVLHLLLYPMQARVERRRLARWLNRGCSSGPGRRPAALGSGTIEATRKRSTISAAAAYFCSVYDLGPSSITDTYALYDIHPIC